MLLAWSRSFQLKLRLSMCTRRRSVSSSLPPKAQSIPQHQAAPPHTCTGPSDLPGKPGPNESAWCAANCSLQSRLQLSLAPAHTRPRQQGKSFHKKAPHANTQTSACTCSPHSCILVALDTHGLLLAPTQSFIHSLRLSFNKCLLRGQDSG